MNSAGFDRQSNLNPAEFFSQRWQNLIKLYLPVSEKDSIWRYSRLRVPNDPEQGWKLHVSATILTAAEVLEAVAPFLKSRNAFYKVPVSLHELKKINAGIFYDYALIGKFITVYPQNDEQSVDFAERLHQLTYKIASPSVPFESKFKPQSSVHYRYGAFKVNEIKNSDGSIVLAMRDKNGDFIPDLRAANAPHPDWVTNPFPVKTEASKAIESPLKRNFRVFRALVQRGKGGVYEALDLSGSTPRLCLLKEGRKHGEVEWDGRDGFWRVRHEEFVLKNLKAAQVNVPQIYGSFEAENNFYLATEFIEGANLHAFLRSRKRRLKISKAIEFAVQMAEIISRIHKAGWLWRDCKPANLIVGKNGKLRPVDFEGACLIKKPDAISWNTLTIETNNPKDYSLWQSTEVVDLYALGAVIFLLFEGELPLTAQNNIPQILRKNVPAKIKKIVASLLNPTTAKSIQAIEIERELKKIQKSSVV